WSTFQPSNDREWGGGAVWLLGEQDRCCGDPTRALGEGEPPRADLGAQTCVARRCGRGCTLDSELRGAARPSSRARAPAVATAPAAEGCATSPQAASGATCCESAPGLHVAGTSSAGRRCGGNFTPGAQRAQSPVPVACGDRVCGPGGGGLEPADAVDASLRSE